MLNVLACRLKTNRSLVSSFGSFLFSSLTHIDPASNQPQMVDVHEKKETYREAIATGKVLFPPSILPSILEKASKAVPEESPSSSQLEIQTRKGPLIATAIIGGTQGAKLTSTLIPFCHPLLLEKIKLNIELDEEAACFLVRSTVGTTGKTGVEMEALAGVSIASLTLYDMLKGLSHHLEITDIRLQEKRGGKSDFRFEERV